MPQDTTVARVARQYEEHPYPNAPWFALARPSRAHAHPLVFEWGQYLRTGRFVPHDENTRILVAGSGTFEPIVVARAHPKAQIVAVDLSATALRRLKFRALLSGVLKRLTCVTGDLHDDLRSHLGEFDYIVCTGVAHHSPRPELIVSRLASLLKPTGVLRLMVYAPRSRGWVYDLQRYFARTVGTSASATREACEAALAPLGAAHPFCSTFRTYSDATSRAGLIDGFFHAHDRPISLEDLRAHTAAAELELVGFGHAYHSQPQAFARALEKTALSSTWRARFDALDAWERLGVLDDLGELAVNPVFWLAPRIEQVATATPTSTVLNPALAAADGVPAPLLAPVADELIATYFARDARALAERERLVCGGCLIGQEGSLPPALLSMRAPRVLATCPAPPALAKENPAAWLALGAPQADARLVTEKNFEDVAPDAKTKGARVLVPSPTRVRLVAGLRSALARLGVVATNDAAEWLEALSRVIEERVDHEGQTLPWLSLKELLTQTQREKLVEATRGSPAPPSRAQWEKLLGPSGADRVEKELLARGATAWSVEIKL